MMKYELLPVDEQTLRVTAAVRVTYPNGKVREYSVQDLLDQQNALQARIDAGETLKSDLSGLQILIAGVQAKVAKLPLEPEIEEI